MVDRTRRGTAERVRDAVDTGRAGARRREDDLWRDLGVGDGGGQARAERTTVAEHAPRRPGYHRLPR